MPEFACVLLLDINDARRTVAAQSVRSRGVVVLEAATLEQATRGLSTGARVAFLRLDSPAPLLVSVAERAADAAAAPILIGVGSPAIGPDTLLKLGRLGMQGPLETLPPHEDLDDLFKTWASELLPPTALLRSWMGKYSVRDAIETVRLRMVSIALAREGGSISAAARQLQVTRQAVQQMMDAVRSRPGST